MSFWQGETCEHCGGAMAEQRVTLHRMLRGRHVLFENVPAGVCSECGMRCYSANVLKTVEDSLHGRRKASR